MPSHFPSMRSNSHPPLFCSRPSFAFAILSHAVPLALLRTSHCYAFVSLPLQLCADPSDSVARLFCSGRFTAFALLYPAALCLCDSFPGISFAFHGNAFPLLINPPHLLRGAVQFRAFSFPLRTLPPRCRSLQALRCHCYAYPYYSIADHIAASLIRAMPFRRHSCRTSSSAIHIISAADPIQALLPGAITNQLNSLPGISVAVPHVAKHLLSASIQGTAGPSQISTHPGYSSASQISSVLCLRMSWRFSAFPWLVVAHHCLRAAVHL